MFLLVAPLFSHNHMVVINIPPTSLAKMTRSIVIKANKMNVIFLSFPCSTVDPVIMGSYTFWVCINKKTRQLKCTNSVIWTSLIQIANRGR